MSATKGFGDRLAQERREKAARDRRDLSQKDVAEAIGSSTPSVSRWESGLGVPTDAMMEKLARYFGVTMGWLRYGQEPRLAPQPPVVSGLGPEHGVKVPDERIADAKEKVARQRPTKRKANGGRHP